MRGREMMILIKEGNRGNRKILLGTKKKGAFKAALLFEFCLMNSFSWESFSLCDVPWTLLRTFSRLRFSCSI